MAGEDIALRGLPGFEAVIDVHGDGAFGDAGAARAAHAGATGVGQVEAGAERCIEDRLVGSDRDEGADPVGGDPGCGMRGGFCGRRHDCGAGGQ